MELDQREFSQLLTTIIKPPTGDRVELYLDNFRNLIAKLIPWRWKLCVLVAFLGLALVLLVHRPLVPQDLDDHLVWEILLLCVALPALLGLGLSLLRSNARLSQAISQADIRQNLREQLFEASNVDNLASAFFQVFATLMPNFAGVLTVLDENGQISISKQWSQEGFSMPRVVPSPAFRTCPLHRKEPVALSPSSISPCQCAIEQQANPAGQVYCVCLSQARNCFGYMHIYRPTQKFLKTEQSKTLLDLLPDVALAIEHLQMRQFHERHSDKVRAERQRLARHLHDTLAHDLAYLRLQLDHFANNDSLSISDEASRTIKHLQEVANHSYEQVRSSVAELQEKPVNDLLSEIREYANILAKRADIQYDLSITGKPQKLAPHVERQILLIIREALRNIEKHAGSQNATLQLAWGKEALEITVWDDGKGFELDKLKKPAGGYGVQIMLEATEELGGRFTLSSRVENGTCVTIFIPIE